MLSQHPGASLSFLRHPKAGLQAPVEEGCKWHRLTFRMLRLGYEVEVLRLGYEVGMLRLGC